MVAGTEGKTDVISENISENPEITETEERPQDSAEISPEDNGGISDTKIEKEIEDEKNRPAVGEKEADKTAESEAAGKEDKKEEDKNRKKRESKKEKEIDKKEGEISRLKGEIEKLKEENRKLLRRMMYIQAEMENTRKLMTKRMEQERYRTKIDTIKMFLPVEESLESAIRNLEMLKSKSDGQSGEDIMKNLEKYLEGFKMVQRHFLGILNAAGIKPIDKTGVPFNYREHEVLMKVDNDEYEEDTVIQIIQKGWYIGDNILRPAKVVVSKKVKKEEKEQEKKEEKREEIGQTEETKGDNGKGSENADNKKERKNIDEKSDN